MSINRRNFFKVIGVTGISLGLGKQLSASPKEENETEFYSILHDSTRCMGCQGCEYACAEANGLLEPDANDMPVAGIVRKTNETRRLVVNAHETSQGELYIKNQCMIRISDTGNIGVAHVKNIGGFACQPFPEQIFHPN